MLKSLGKAVVLTVALSAMIAAADSPFAGTWKANIAQSKYQPGPAPQSQTVTIGPADQTTVEGVDAQGKPISWSFTPSKGMAVPITGLAPGSTVTETKITDRTVEHIWRVGKGHTVGRAVLASDGKSFTYTQKGKDGNGQVVRNVIVYDKQ